MPDYRHRAYEPGIKEQAVDMAINGSGIRDTARVLKTDKNTVTGTLKKKRPLLCKRTRGFFRTPVSHWT